MYNQDGTYKKSEEEGQDRYLTDIAGPLCFSGDLLVHSSPWCACVTYRSYEHLLYIYYNSHSLKKKRRRFWFLVFSIAQVKGKMLPEIRAGDFIVAHDTGAYCMAMWSRFNSRLSPPVMGFSNATMSASATNDVQALFRYKISSKKKSASESASTMHPLSILQQARSGDSKWARFSGDQKGIFI